MKIIILSLFIVSMVGCEDFREITDNSTLSTVTVTSKITGKEITIKNVWGVTISSEKGISKDGGTGIINIYIALQTNGTFYRKTSVEFSQSGYTFISIPNELIED